MRLLREEEKETLSWPFKGSVEATVSEASNIYLFIYQVAGLDCITDKGRAAPQFYISYSGTKSNVNPTSVHLLP